MNSRINLKQFQGFLLVPSLIVVTTPNAASAIEIKDTNYPIPNNAYFVAPNGKDNNSGKSPNSPWSVAKALKSAPAGSTIVFRGGQYHKATGKINKKLTLQAYPREKPWLKGSIKVTGWVADGGMWRKDGWNYSLPVIDSVFIDPKYPMARYTDMVYINGVSLKQVASKAQVAPGKFYVDKGNNKLYIGNNPAGKTVEVTVLAKAFGLWQNRNSNPAKTVIRGLGFAHYGNRALEVGAPNLKLENNTIVWNGNAGVVLNVDSKNAVVRGNTFSYNGRTGFGGQADGMLFENNTISYNNIERFRKAWAAAGFKVFKTSDLVFRNNLVENNFATGVWFDVSCLNNTIINNTVRNNESIGIFYEISHKAFISGNTVSNNGAGIMLADSSDSQVVNNTLINNRGKDQVVIKDSRRINTNRDEKARGIMWISRNNVVRNNSFK